MDTLALSPYLFNSATLDLFVTPPLGAQPRLLLDDQSRGLCHADAGWLSASGTVELLSAGRKARLVTSWYVVNSSDQRTDTVYQDRGLVQNGDRFSMQGYWPGIRLGDTIVQAHMSAFLLDLDTGSPLPGQTGSLDYYWNQWVCSP